MKKVVYLLMTVLAIGTVKAQIEISAGADFVSSSTWRGMYLAGASVQPTLELSSGNFTIGAWGSMDIASQETKEVDLSVSYAFGAFTVGITDYWWNGENAFDYFNFKKNATSHILEANLSYAHESGFSLAWNTMFAGTEDKDADGDRIFSTYVEAGYAFDVNGVGLEAALGFSPWKPNYMYATTTDKFAVTNVSLTASKTIGVTEKFSLPVFSQLIFNPAKEDVFLVFGVSF